MTCPLRSLLPGLALAFGCVLLALGPAAATVQPNPSPSPNNATVNLLQGSSFSVIWQVSDASTSATRTVFSNQGAFLIGGAVVATVNRRIAAPPIPPGFFNLNIPETVIVPRSVAAQAAKSGAPLTYQRTFGSTDAVITEVSLPISLAVTGSGGDLLLSRIELTFEAPAEARFASVDKDDRLRALARVRFGGSGLLQARWVVADPSSTVGRAVFRTLQIVRRNLPTSGEVEILSPPLPTGEQGIYELRFEVDDPEIESPPRLLYQVRLKTEPEVSPDAATISLLSPGPRGPLDEDASISWSAVPGAVAYKVVFLESLADETADLEERARYGELPDDPGVTRPGETVAGFYLPGDTTETLVPGTSMTRLARNTRYYVQVLSWGPDGVILGRSEPQEVLRR